MTKEENNFGCKTHPDAPHGFVRNASHSEDRYVCECEFWEPPEQNEPVAYINVEQRKLEWAKYTSWETPTVVNLPKIPLYTKPQTKEWVELTEYEIKGVLGLSESWVGEDCSIPDMIGFAKAIQSKSKEKNT